VKSVANVVTRSRCSFAILFLLLVAPTPAAVPQSRAEAQQRETALDRYVAAPDPNFRFAKAGELRALGDVSVTLLELTSQQWLTSKEVDRPIWRHWLVVYRPARVTGDTALLYLGGGSSTGKRPQKTNGVLAALAHDTGSVTAELRMIPNQPLTFKSDPTRKERSEDEIVAFTWDRYLRTADERWPLRLPMTKAAVRAMDTLTAWTASAEGGGRAATRFVLAGGSKRGWTAWTAAAVDHRVVALIAAVIDALNIVPSFKHHWQAYGFWAPAVSDYQDMKIMEWLDTPQFAALMAIEDPWSYRSRLTMPKLLLNSAGDQFFLPDSSRFYFEALAGENHLRYIPNSDHSLDATNAFETLQAFYTAIVTGTPRPQFSWTTDATGKITVTSKTVPSAVHLWQANNPKARDFRLETLGAKWSMSDLMSSGPNTWSARVPSPSAGWTAAFVELTFPSGGRYPLIFTTSVLVTPERLPFPPPGSDAVKESRRP
jgi:PhoPQ-activated pathogenicity-related protein